MSMHASDGEPRLRLLGGFELGYNGAVVNVDHAGQRVLSFLALRDRRVSRALVAGSLWPETVDAKASASLRTALCRLHGSARALVLATQTTLELRADVRVDTRELEAVVRGVDSRSEQVADPVNILPADLSGELLPDLWDGWLVFDRERVRQLSLHALEWLSRELSDRGRHARAVLAGLAAVELEPLRETANRALVEAHLAEGNPAEARRHYHRYASLLARELGLEPGAPLRALVEGVSTTVTRV